MRIPSIRFVGLLLWMAVVLGAAGPVAVQPVQAQQPTVPRDADAELLFEQGLAAFERGNYGTAYERFRLVNDYSLNRKTTAALLMAGKSLYRMDRYQDAIDLLQTLRSRYPQSSYADDAQSVIDAARTAVEQYGQVPDTLHVGIALPMTDQDASLTQAMFNGIRLAADAHNGVRRRYVLPRELQAEADTFNVYDTAALFGDSLAQADGATTIATPTDTVQVDSIRVVTEQVGQPNWLVKMHFRGTGTEPDGIRAAIDSLVSYDRVDVIIGPLYSRDARIAGEVAERLRVPFIAPLATDESVSKGRQYVFQANPTLALRGEIMARYAKESLLIESAGILYEKGNRISEQMAQGFSQEAQRRGMDVTFELQLQNPRDWSRLPAAFAADSTVTDSMLAVSEAIYIPMAGRNAGGKIQDALTGIGRLPTEARVLGNAEWHDLSIEQEASRFLATYTNDFYVDTSQPAVQRFIRSYRLLTGETPDDLSVTARRLAYTGYDVTDYLLQALRPSPGRPDPAAIRQASPFRGLGLRIDFRGGTVNRAMFFHRYRSNRIELLP